MPSKRKRQRITEADSLIVAIATWIGHCTVFANKCPFEGEGGKTLYRRDSSAVRSDRLRVQNMGPGGQKMAIKRKAPSSDVSVFMAKVPRISPMSAVVAKKPECIVLAANNVSSDFLPNKRIRLTARHVEEGSNYVFMEYYWAARRHSTPLRAPTVSAGDRHKAMLSRMALRTCSINARTAL